MKHSLKLVTATAALMLSAGAVQAQSWSTDVAPGNDAGQFWDNGSDDGEFCNIGHVLSGVAGGVNAPCMNQRPAGWLPWQGVNPTHYLNDGFGGHQHFLFGAGSYIIDQLASFSLGGDVAGGNTEWGYFEFDGMGNRIQTNLNTVSPGSDVGPLMLTFSGAWGLWINLVGTGTPVFSDNSDVNRFSLFGYGEASMTGNTIDHVGHQVFWAGLEDGRRDFSDHDFNDAIFRITATPEPGTYALVAAGLVGLFGLARRRRNV